VLTRIALLSLGVAAAACGSTAGSSSAETGVVPEVGRRDRSVIQNDEIQNVQGALNLYEVVQRLHPEWLNVRSTSTSGQRSGTAMNTDSQVQVYIDTQRAGSAEILKTMPLRSASSLKYFSASDAQVRFGTGNLGGAIQVITAMK
jgi:hypothetical protein